MTSSILSRPQLDLAELLDRTLGAGVVVAGDVTLSVADVELVYLNLRALVASVATLEARGVPFSASLPGEGARPAAAGPRLRSPAEDAAERHVPATPPAAGRRELPAAASRDERLERGLAQLVLAVTELLRKLMERQALRRVEAGTLEPEQIERLGTAFERLERELHELKVRFELDDDDLTLRLGPLPPLGDL